MKLIYLWKHGRPDIGTAVSSLAKQVREPDLDDWKKLDHLVTYLKADCTQKWQLGADNSKDLMWYVDCAFGVHLDYRSHTGGRLTMGKGFAITISKGHRLNVRSLTEGETVSVDNCLSLILWSCKFMIAQGYGCKRNIIVQKNKRSINVQPCTTRWEPGQVTDPPPDD